ncbi:MAG: glycosyltransferase family 39 protein [Elusimicrobia bacterium]|nr:glycosyltransferase family 39 protein [Elusimicrobiota bacterium]
MAVSREVRPEFSWRKLLEKPEFHLAALVIVGVAMHLNQPWLGGLAGWDDAWYASGAIGMIDARSLLTPIHNGYPTFFTAPPLSFWLLALSFLIFGPTTFAAKFAGGISTLLAVLVIFFVTRKLFRSTPLAAMAAMAFNMDPFILKYGHHALAHTAWAGTVALALGALYAARKRPLFYLAFALLSAASILFKSVLGVFPLMIGGIWFLWDGASTKEWLRFTGAALLALLLGGSWFIVEYIQFGDYFLKEHLGGMLYQYSGVERISGAPFRLWESVLWPMSKASLVGLLFLPFGLRALWTHRSSEERLVFAWILVPIISMAMTMHPAPKYMAPAFAGMAISTGYFLHRVLSPRVQQNFLVFLYSVGLVWALANLALPIHRGRNFLAETQPLLDTLQKEVPVGSRWVYVVAPHVPLDPQWPNRMMAEYSPSEGPLMRGVVNQILFYTRRHYKAIHLQDLKNYHGAESIVFSANHDLPPHSSPRLRPILSGPDWTLYRFTSFSAKAS